MEYSVDKIEKNSGYMSGAYERLCGIKENYYLQSGIEKSMSTVAYITPTFAQESIKQYYSDASHALANIYTNPTDSLSNGKGYIGEKLSDGKGYVEEYIGGKLTSGRDIVSSAKERVGAQVSSGTDYVKDKLNSNAEYVQSTRVGQVLKTGVDKGLTTADGVIEYLLPGAGPGEQEVSREDGVWEHGKEVTSKAKDRVTTVIANRYYQTGDYLGNKYTKSKEGVEMAKGYAYKVTVAKGNQIGQQFKYGKDYLDTLTMVQKLSKNFGEAVMQAQDIVDKYIPESGSVSEVESDEVERGSLEHAVKLTKRIQKGLLGKMREVTGKLPSFQSLEATGIANKSIFGKVSTAINQLPIPKVVKGFFPQYFKEENDDYKVEDKTATVSD